MLHVYSNHVVGEMLYQLKGPSITVAEFNAACHRIATL